MRKRVHSSRLAGISLLQIYLVVTTTVAFAFLLGQAIPSVDALTVAPPSVTGTPAVSSAAKMLTIEGKNYIVTNGQLLQQSAAGGFEAAGTVGASQSAAYGPMGLVHTSNFALGSLYAGLSWGLVVAGMVKMIATLFGADAGTSNALAMAAGAGVFAYHAALALFGHAAAGTSGLVGTAAAGQVGVLGMSTGLTTLAATGIGIVIAAIVFIATFKKTKQELITFECLPWEPALGGSKCEQCNNDPLRPCSEYRCKALGQACELLNPNTENAQCAWVSKSDTQSPTIMEWAEVLRPTDLRYTPNNALRPGARGVKIVSNAPDSCLPAFTNLQFGVLTNEPAQCKIDYNRSVSFDDMQFYIGGSNYYEYNHSQRMRLPDPSDTDLDLSPILQNDGTFSMFIRCRDANGNTNIDEYSINYCVSAGPDTTPPVIEGSSLEDGTPVQHGADVVPIEVYTNEPAACKWSIMDKSYADMENAMTCAQDASQINANLQYTCSGSLTGVANAQANDFYFRCLDQPTKPENERNVMTQSYKISLRGTQPLTLLKAGPNATTIRASTSSVDVELFAQTDDGADDGKAICYFSTSGDTGSFIEFYETDAVDHKQALSLPSGNYTYYIRCVDYGGNTATTDVKFSVEVDKDLPIVTRVYKRGTDSLQIVTNEAAQCFYSRTSCNFVTEEGLAFNYVSPEQQRVHVAAWKDNSPYYIKCRDPYGNEPSPNSCSIIVSGVDLSVQAVAG